MAISLDSDGFLRRQCQACSREFKWLPSESSDPSPDGGYGCPYCRARAEDFWTDEQRSYLAGQAGKVFLGHLKTEGWSVEGHPLPAEPHEPDDMVRVDFGCHSTEPVKVYEEWAGSQPVYCIVCGGPA